MKIIWRIKTLILARIKALPALCNSYTASHKNLIEEQHNLQQVVQLKEKQYELDDKEKCKL